VAPRRFKPPGSHPARAFTTCDTRVRHG
jgi:hypothetical protein